MKIPEPHIKTALLFGASGLVGNHLLRELLKDNYYEKVKIFVRKPLNINDPKLTEHIIDFNNLSSYSELFKGVTIFCCLGTTIKKAGSQAAFRKVDFDYPYIIGKLCEANNVNHYLLVSSIGANINSKSFYPKLKGEIEQEIIKLGFEKASIFRSSFLVGERKEKRAGEKIGILISNLFSFLSIGRLKEYKPILAKTVAKAMLATAKKTSNNKISIYESSQI
jgi:uncharacterized protein YbjT (DUF2867 family)